MSRTRGFRCSILLRYTHPSVTLLYHRLLPAASTDKFHLAQPIPVPIPFKAAPLAPPAPSDDDDDDVEISTGNGQTTDGSTKKRSAGEAELDDGTATTKKAKDDLIILD